MRSDSKSGITNALEMANSGANLGCALADFYGHYSSRDRQVYGLGGLCSVDRHNTSVGEVCLSDCAMPMPVRMME